MEEFGCGWKQTLGEKGEEGGGCGYGFVGRRTQGTVDSEEEEMR